MEDGRIGVADLGPSATLQLMRRQQAAAQAAEAGLLLAVAHWADLHSVRDIADAADGGELEIPLAGEGTPLVAEFCIPDLAATLRVTDGSARRLLGDTLELRHRLPRTWTRIHQGALPAWRGRKVAQATSTLPLEGALWIDSQVAAFAHRISYGRLLDLVQEAVVTFDPELAARKAELARDARHVTLGNPGLDGQVTIWALVDAPDGHAFDQALNRTAAAQAALGDASPHDVRRSKAMGLLADPQAALDLFAAAEGDATAPQRSGIGRPGLTLYVHLSEQDALSRLGAARVEGMAPQVIETIRQWCGSADAVWVQPVLDLNADLRSVGRHPSERLREEVLLRDHTCVFPWCDKRGRNQDLDHIEPYDENDPQTTAENLARLCRFHHRVKTHGRWRERRLPVDQGGGYLWTSPFGDAFHVDANGTTSLSADAC